jgi:ABC-type nickel/cobalt efflux system permease component RcnA
MNDIGSILKTISLELGKLLSQVQNDSAILPLLLLLLLSFLYGLLHAAGPGHGKTLVASYFVAQDKSYKKAFIISGAIAITHVFSAFIITIVGYFILTDILSFTIYGSNKIISQISGLAIVLIGTYLLYNKFKHYTNRPKNRWSTQPFSSCACSSCVNKDTTELALILSAGIIPCPGTITIFLLALSTGVYTAAFLSAIAMSLGMSTVIAVSAILSVKFRKSAKNRFSKYLTIIDFGAIFIIILLGLALVIQ